MRRLTVGERRLAQSVFGDALDLDRVRLAPHLPGRTAITLGRTIVFPSDTPADFSLAPPSLQAWLIHELVHVWQFERSTARTVGSWARTLLTGGYGPRRRAYDYAHPFAWDRLNLEQQASAVEHAFLLRCGAASSPPLTLADYEGRTPFQELTRVA
ncbi:hypothetical protein BH09PSE2_BH09PSE2_23510 [soil metagenome]